MSLNNYSIEQLQEALKQKEIQLAKQSCFLENIDKNTSLAIENSKSMSTIPYIAKEKLIDSAISELLNLGR